MKKVFLMIDMQNDFINGVLGNAETCAVLPEMIQKVQYSLKNGYEMLYTMDTHGSDYMNTLEGKNLTVPHCIKGTEGWEIPEELKKVMENIPPERKIEKNTFGARNLPEKILEICGEVPQEIEIAGVCTDICVISNAVLLKAFFPDTVISVAEKYCAGTSVESHKRAVEAMKMCHINII